MINIWKGQSLWIGGLFLAAVLPLAQAAAPAIPGTINYIEGQVTLSGRALTPKSAGSTQMEPNQVLATTHGKAEILLTPGIFLRIGDNSSVRLVSPELANTQVELLTGEALVEATEVLKANNITVLDHGATTRLEKNGLYDFKAAPPMVAVYDGKASVLMDDQKATLGKGKEVQLAAGKLKAQGFDRKAQDPLYAWSSLRSEYASEASVGMARTIVVDGGWWGPGWYWNSGWGMYSYLPGSYLYSPFGWGFFSPGYAYYAPLYRGGFYRGGFVGSRSGLAGRGFAPAARSGGFSGGFHGGGGHR